MHIVWNNFIDFGLMPDCPHNKTILIAFICRSQTKTLNHQLKLFIVALNCVTNARNLKRYPSFRFEISEPTSVLQLIYYFNYLSRLKNLLKMSNNFINYLS